MKDLSFLINEQNLYNILHEMYIYIIYYREPLIESKGAPIDLNEDNSFGIKYSNFVSILNSMETYFSRHEEKDNFTVNSFKALVSINDLLKNNTEQLIILSELIIFMTSISSKKNDFLVKVEGLENNACSFFLSIIEKYILIENEETNQSRNMMMTKSSKSHLGLKEDKNYLLQIITEQDTRLYNMKIQIEKIEKQKKELEQKLKDKENELELFYNNNKEAKLLQEELINTAINTVELNKKLNEKDVEITQLQKEKELLINTQKEKTKNLKEEIEILTDKLYDYNEIKAKLEKVNTKYKNLKEKKSEEKDEAINNEVKLNDKEKAIDILSKEKKALNKLTEKYKKEIIDIKTETGKKNLEIDKLKVVIEDLQTELAKEKKKVAELQKDQIDMSNIGCNLDNVLDESTLRRYDSNISYFIPPTSKTMKKINFDCIIKEQDDDLDLENEKEELRKDNETLKEKINKILAEKNELQNNYNKIQIDQKKLTLELERRKNDITQLEKSKKTLNDNLQNVMTNKGNEIDKLKKEVSKKNEQIETLNKEKKNMQNEINKYQQEDKSINNNIKDSDILAYKNEIQSLNFQNIQKDQEIKKLKEELENKEYKDNLLTEEDIESKLADLDFYKKSFEEQKRRVNQEHEIISDSLYKLALHFMSIKDTLNKKNSK